MVRWIAFIIVAIFVILGQYTLTDVANAVTYYGSKLSPTHSSLGSFIFLMIIGLVLFTDDFLLFIRNRKRKVKQKF